MKHHHRLVRIALLLAGLAVLAGCETIRALLTFQEPEVRAVGARVSELSFGGAEITVDLEVENPNPVSVTLQGFSYELFIEGQRFLGGSMDEGVQIDANGRSDLSVPVAFGFVDLLSTVQSLGDAVEARYALLVEVQFELPIIGELTVPVATEGTFPVIRRPGIELRAAHLQSIGLSGAEMELEIQVSNPNATGLRIESLVYQFSVQGESWVDGETSRPQLVRPLQESTVTLPFTLRFLSVGRAARTILMGDDSLDYRLDLSAVIGTDIELVPAITLPLTLQGTVPLRR